VVNKKRIKEKVWESSGEFGDYDLQARWKRVGVMLGVSPSEPLVGRIMWFEISRGRFTVGRIVRPRETCLCSKHLPVHIPTLLLHSIGLIFLQDFILNECLYVLGKM
jgi:hypothetical protein